jgi:putative DNA primase/helicase
MVDGIACQMIPESAAGQVHRVGGRFALVAAAGELATQAGITGWPEGEATRAARQCFEAWMKQRGGLGNAEQYQMLAQVRNFLQLHGAGRFTWWHRAGDDHAPSTLSRAGYRRFVGSDGKPVRSNAEHQREYGEKMSAADAEGTSVEYFVFCEVFDGEVCQGFDPTAVKRLLLEVEHLEPTTDKAGNFERYARRERLPGIGNANVIKIKPSIFDGSE